MDECPENVLKKLCCTCLSGDRKLFQLCRIPDGVNILYLLLSYDFEAYREGFYKDTASLFICWECRAVMFRIMRFRQQACTAQKQYTSIADGKTLAQTTTLSRLTTNHSVTYQKLIHQSNLSDNFIDCGPTTIKTESEDDIPLSELHNNWLSDDEAEIDIPTTEDRDTEYKKEVMDKNKSILCSNGVETKDETEMATPTTDYKKRKKNKNGRKKSLFSTVLITDEEFNNFKLNNKLEEYFVNAEFKCDNCVEVFNSDKELELHNELHTEKPDHLQCDICLIYTTIDSYQEHREAHYHKHICQHCVYSSYNVSDMVTHLRGAHDMADLVLPVKKKIHKKTSAMLKPEGKSRKTTTTDRRTPYGYLCTECNKYFDNKNQRWKHVQRHHREGYKCNTCGKRFAFKNNLNRHELTHQGSAPRSECGTCHKMVRLDLLKVHARIHTHRQTYSCVECNKHFVSRASYEHHLKYTQAHALLDILKYKCTTCDKGYRSRGELRDHVNYQHMGKTQHKCPICGKALATRRCITRHVRRAHDGVKESARDKICQQCGKAFRDKKGLREHELIHTGERPLSCEICGCTFRQSASLYTHRKRVHKIYPNAKRVTLLDTT